MEENQDRNAEGTSEFKRVKLVNFLDMTSVVGVDRQKFRDKVVVYTTSRSKEPDIPLYDSDGRSVEVVLLQIKNGQVDPAGEETVIREAGCQTSRSEIESNGNVAATTCSAPLPGSRESLRAAATALWKEVVAAFQLWRSSRLENRPSKRGKR